MQVKKRDGTLEDLNIDKLHKVVMYACEGISGVSASEVEINSHIQFFDKILSTDIQETLIKSAADLISEDSPNYQYVGGRLINYHLRKEVYGTFEPPCLCDIIQDNIDAGFINHMTTALASIHLYNKHGNKNIKKILNDKGINDYTTFHQYLYSGKIIRYNEIKQIIQPCLL